MSAVLKLGLRLRLLLLTLVLFSNCSWATTPTRNTTSSSTSTNSSASQNSSDNVGGFNWEFFVDDTVNIIDGTLDYLYEINGIHESSRNSSDWNKNKENPTLPWVGRSKSRSERDTHQNLQAKSDQSWYNHHYVPDFVPIEVQLPQPQRAIKKANRRYHGGGDYDGYGGGGGYKGFGGLGARGGSGLTDISPLALVALMIIPLLLALGIIGAALLLSQNGIANSNSSAIPGPPGPVGPAGTAGTNGIPGTPGVAGPAGTAGTPGTDGVPGADGTPGMDGTPGADGNPGKNGRRRRRNAQSSPEFIDFRSIGHELAKAYKHLV